MKLSRTLIVAWLVALALPAFPPDADASAAPTAGTTYAHNPFEARVDALVTDGFERPA